MESDLKLKQEVKATLCSGNVVNGVIIGLNEDCDGNVQVTVKYLPPTTNTFAADKVQAK